VVKHSPRLGYDWVVEIRCTISDEDAHNVIEGCVRDQAV
jgi:hypothetical protein